MTTKDIIEAHSGEWVRWGVPMIFAAGMAWALVKTVPAMQEKLQSHDTHIAVIQTRLGSIETGISDIKESLRADRSRQASERRYDLSRGSDR